VAPIGYGPPTPDLVEILAVGGYRQVDRPWFEGAPDQHCETCGHEWLTEDPAVDDEDDLPAGGAELDTDELAERLAERTGLPAETVAAVLEVETEFEAAIGIIPATGIDRWRWFDPDGWRGHPRVINEGWLAAEAARIADVPVDTALAVLAAKIDWLIETGLALDEGDEAEGEDGDDADGAYEDDEVEGEFVEDDEEIDLDDDDEDYDEDDEDEVDLSWPPVDGTRVIYGTPWDDRDRVYFAPASLLAAMDACREALASSTWGEFRQVAARHGPATYHALAADFDPEEYPDDEPFNAYSYPGVEAGDMPPHIGAFAPLWWPEGVSTRYLRAYDTIFNGTYWFVDPDELDEVIAALTAAGMQCERDDGEISCATSLW
jgi:hypothetical protein